MPPRTEPQDATTEVPAPRTSEESQPDAPPGVTVLGRVNNNFAVRTGWNKEVHTVSPARLKFLADIGIDVMDNPDEYVL